MQDHQHEFNIERMSKVFAVSVSGYYKFLLHQPSARELANNALLAKIKSSYSDSRNTYGSPRIYSELKAGGEVCSRKRVARLMQQHQIVAKMKKRFKVTTKANIKAIAAPNLPQQDFVATAPNKR